MNLENCLRSFGCVPYILGALDSSTPPATVKSAFKTVSPFYSASTERNLSSAILADGNSSSPRDCLSCLTLEHRGLEAAACVNCTYSLDAGFKPSLPRNGRESFKFKIRQPNEHKKRVDGKWEYPTCPEVRRTSPCSCGSPAHKSLSSEFHPSDRYSSTERTVSHLQNKYPALIFLYPHCHDREHPQDRTEPLNSKYNTNGLLFRVTAFQASQIHALKRTRSESNTSMALDPSKNLGLSKKTITVHTWPSGGG